MRPLVVTYELNPNDIVVIHSDHSTERLPLDCDFDWLRRTAQIKGVESKAKHVTFDLDRIAACWLRPLDDECLSALHRFGHVVWNDITFRYLSGKYLSVSFGKSRFFLVDLKQYFGTPLDVALRNFGAANLMELTQQILVAMRDELDGIPKVLSGPSGMASVSENEHGVERYRRRDSHPEWQDIVKHSYFGGRIEMVRFGNFKTVSHLDISSAYAWALAQVPAMTNSDWKPCKLPDCHFDQFDIGFVHYEAPEWSPDFHPFPHRDEFGYVSFPSSTQTWLWGAELEIARKTSGAEIVEHMHHVQWGTKTKPFTYLAQLYRRRKAVKTPMAEHLQKSALTATYGRTCQWRGWNEFENTAPRSHQLEWAAMTTSIVRAAIWKACQKIGLDKIIAIETDGIYFEGDLPRGIKPTGGFGGWRYEVLHNATFVDSGMIFATGPDGLPYNRTRGFRPGVLTADIVHEWWQAFQYSQRQSYPVVPNMRIEVERMNTLAICAILGNFDRLAQVESHVIELPLYPTGKRVHDMKCWASWTAGNHTTVTTFRSDVESQRYPLPWHKDDFDIVMRNEKNVVLNNEGLM